MPCMLSLSTGFKFVPCILRFLRLAPLTFDGSFSSIAAVLHQVLVVAEELVRGDEQVVALRPLELNGIRLVVVELLVHP